MMTNLFSLFDPSLSLFSFSLVIIFLLFIFFPVFFWFLNNFYYFFFIIISFVKKEVDYVMKFPMKGTYSFIGSIFFIISLYNFLALFPFIFSVTSHMLVTLPLSYSFWVGIISFCVMKSFIHFLSHLIPNGTPVFLLSFMVIVELLSNFIRPIALMFRLTANMMAGHLLMSLIGSAIISLSFSFMLFGSFFQSFLIIMELGVSFIQGYVFSTLLLLYLSDSEH